jgi:hypothetical protein
LDEWFIFGKTARKRALNEVYATGIGGVREYRV